MVNIYKLLIFAFFITIVKNICYAQILMAYHEPEVTLKVTEGSSASAAEYHSSTTNLTHATYKITQETQKINTTLVQKEAALLLHLTSPHNQIHMKVSNPIGQQVMSVYYSDKEAGFYEIPVLPNTPQAHLYFVSLVINHKTYSFQISPTL